MNVGFGFVTFVSQNNGSMLPVNKIHTLKKGRKAMKAKKRSVILRMAVAVMVSALLTGCGGGKTVKGSISGFDGLIIHVAAEDGTAYDFEITDDTELDADHQPEEGDPIEVEYKEEDGKNLAIKATVRGAQ